MPLPCRSLAAALALAAGGLVAACDPMPIGPPDATVDAHAPVPMTDAGFDAGGPSVPDAGHDGGVHDGGLYEDICGPMPAGCAARLCVTSIHFPSWNDCCDSYFCNCDPVTHEWGGIFCDPPPPPDAGVDVDAGAP
jgi:hypothetical protein